MKILDRIKKEQRFPLFMGLFSTTGLLASLILAIEKVHLLENPAVELSCNLNPVYSCNSVILSDQASILGFSNEFLGIAFFGGMLALALALLSGAKFGQWLYKLIWLGLVGSMGFVFWFFYQSVYNINALCIYCSTVWFSLWALFVGYTKWSIDSKSVKIPKKYKNSSQFFSEHAVKIWFLLVAVLVALVLNHFWYYYGQYF